MKKGVMTIALLVLMFGFVSHAHASFFSSITNWFKETFAEGVSLSKSAIHNEVADLQKVLKSQGALAGSVTGTFDTRTRNSIEKFQRNHDLPVTGYIDSKTEELLSKKYIQSQMQQNTIRKKKKRYASLKKGPTNDLVKNIKKKLEGFLQDKKKNTKVKEQKRSTQKMISNQEKDSTKKDNTEDPSYHDKNQIQQLYQRQRGVIPSYNEIIGKLSKNTSPRKRHMLIRYNNKVCVFKERSATRNPWYDTKLTKQQIEKRHPGITNGFYRIFWFGSQTWSGRKFKWNENDADWKSDKHVIRYFYDHWHRYVRCPEYIDLDNIEVTTTSAATNTSSMSRPLKEQRTSQY